MTTLTRACTQCGKRKHRCTCPPHRPTYDHTHQTLRALLLPYAYGTLCPICNELMQHDHALDLDHSTNAITHASCNRRNGAAIVNRGQGGGRQAIEKPSRSFPDPATFPREKA